MVLRCEIKPVRCSYTIRSTFFGQLTHAGSSALFVFVVRTTSSVDSLLVPYGTSRRQPQPGVSDNLQSGLYPFFFYPENASALNTPQIMMEIRVLESLP